MTGPKFTYDRGIATVTWAGDPAVEMIFDRIREDRRTHEVTAEVSYSTGSDGSRSVIHRGRLNTTSTRGKQEAARYLQGLAAGLAWPSLLETACWQVVDAVRRGRPAILLPDAVEPAGDGTLLPPLLLPNDPVILFGDGGSAKSYLGLGLALSVHAGRRYVDLQPTAQLRVAYLDFEWNAWPHKRRMQALCGADSLPGVVYVPCLSEGPLSGQVDRLRRILSEHGTQYVVLDSVALACAGPPEDAIVALDFFQALAQLEVGSCLLAHINRSGDEDRPFGSTFWHNSARMTWFLKSTQEPGQPRLDLALYNRKVNDGPRPESFALHWEFAPTRTTITKTDIRAIPELSGKLPMKERIAGILAARAKTIQDLTDELDADPRTIRRTLTRGDGTRFTRLPGSNPDKWALRSNLEPTP
jgi:hypothetical protein